MKQKKSIWKKLVDKHDFDAALDYLTLLYDVEEAEILVEKLKNTKITIKKAKDICRASGLVLLPASNKHVKEDLKKFAKGIKLSPILIVAKDSKFIIADGFHRVSAAEILDENLEIPCILVH